MNRYREIVQYFLKIGSTGFGGPLALVAMMQQELIVDREWMELEEFNSAISLIKVLPGTFAFQTAVFIGRRRAGFWGGVLAGACLVFPAAVMMCLLAIAYNNWGMEPNFKKVTMGFEIGAMALVTYSLVQISRPYKKHFLFYLSAIIAFVFMYFHWAPEPVIILCMGFFCWLLSKVKSQKKVYEAGTLLLLLWIAFKSGAFVFGSGLAIAPLMERDFVQEYHWIDTSTFLTALAFGQMTPGPVLVTVTFLGYQLAGISGAALATFFIFLPSAFHMLTWFPYFFKKVSASRGFREFSIGAIGAVIGAIAVFILKTGQNYFLAAGPLVLLITCLVLIAKWKIPSWMIVLGSGVVYFCTQIAA